MSRLAFGCFLLLALFKGKDANIIISTELNTVSDDVIISRINAGSKFQCAHKCRRNGVCAHAGYLQDQKLCLLMRDVDTNNNNEDKEIRPKVKDGLLLNVIDPKG